MFSACGGGQNNTPSSNSKPSANTNSTNAATNTTAEKKAETAATDESSEKIKPDPNAKLTDGKENLEGNFYITLPKGWKKAKYGSFEHFVPEKEDANGLVAISFEYESDADFEDEKKTASASPATMVEYYLNKAKEQKSKGKIEAFGTFGVGANGEKSILPIGGIATMSNKPDEADRDAECSAKMKIGCGTYFWQGFDSKEKRQWSFMASFKPETYEKNKPIIDAVLQSIKFH